MIENIRDLCVGLAVIVLSPFIVTFFIGYCIGLLLCLIISSINTLGRVFLIKCGVISLIDIYLKEINNE